MNCRPGCGACCIAPSISSEIPGMPNGKPAGVPCIHLDEAMACGLFGSAERPEVCIRFAPELSVCGNNRDEAMTLITWLEGASG